MPVVDALLILTQSAIWGSQSDYPDHDVVVDELSGLKLKGFSTKSL